MDSKEDYRDLLLLESSPLNTPLDENALPGGSKEVKMKNDSGSMEETMSHQPQTELCWISAKPQGKGENRKRKSEADNLYSLETKIKRTEESIEK